MHRIIIYLLVLISSLQHALWAQHVDMHFSQETCQPGDLIKLHAEMRGDRYASFHLKLPKHPKLFVLNQLNYPARYHNGAYIQKSTWLIQPTDAGKVSWIGIKALISRGDQQSEIELPALRLEVQSYANADSSSQPELLPDSAPPQAFPLVTVTLVALSLLTAVAIFFFKTKKTRQTEPNNERTSPPTLSSIKSALESGSIPHMEILYLLEHATVSPAIQNLLERAVYSHSITADELLTAMGEEATV